jgi:hypothetical protein
MDADLAALPDDIDALKAALMIERAKARDMQAERDCGFQCIPPTHTDFKSPIVLISKRPPF